MEENGYKANVAIIAESGMTWDHDSIGGGIGGSEEAIIYASEVLAREGYRVVIFSNPPQNSRWALPNNPEVGNESLSQSSSTTHPASEETMKIKTKSSINPTYVKFQLYHAYNPWVMHALNLGPSETTLKVMKTKKTGGNNVLKPGEWKNKAYGFDHIICWRRTDFAFIKAVAGRIQSNAPRLYFWPHDNPINGIPTSDIRDLDAVFYLSIFQKRNFEMGNPELAKLPNVIAGNGIGGKVTSLPSLSSLSSAQSGNPQLRIKGALRGCILEKSEIKNSENSQIKKTETQKEMQISTDTKKEDSKKEKKDKQKEREKEKDKNRAEGIKTTLELALPEQIETILHNKNKNPTACIWLSNWARGIEVLLWIWPRLKKAVPEATLDIYYGPQTWGLWSPQKTAEVEYAITQMKPLGVTNHGMVGHAQLDKGLEGASVWTYPCNCFAETYCIAAVKAQLYGLIPVATKPGALAETIMSNAQHGKDNKAIASSNISFPDSYIHIANDIKSILAYEKMLIDTLVQLKKESTERPLALVEKRMEYVKFAAEKTWNRCVNLWITLF